MVQLLLEKTTTDDALLTNASGQNPLDLLIMFINYGNISLTSNLLKVRVLAFVMFHPLTLLKGCENVSNGFDDGHFQYRGSSLITIFGIWKKSYYEKFVLVGTT